MMPRRLARTESVKMGEPAEDLPRRIVQYNTVLASSVVCQVLQGSGLSERLVQSITF